MTTSKYVKGISLMMLAGAALSLTACDKDNPTPNDGGKVEPAKVKFIVTASDLEKDLFGGAYMKVFDDLTNTSRTNVSIYGEADAVKSFDGYTQFAFNHTTNVFTASIYAKGGSEQGIGKRQNGLRTYTYSDGKLTVLQPLKIDKFGNVGAYGSYSYATELGNPFVMRVDAKGNGQKIAIDFSKWQINGANPDIYGITDLGNNQVAIAVSYADRDSFGVAFADYDLNVSSVITSTRAGHGAAGRKATRYNPLVKDADGNLYAFGGTATSDAKVGAVRIKKGAKEFDTDYYFDLLKASDGYRVRKAFHITSDKFLLEFFAEKGKAENMGATGRFAVVDMSDKSLTWVTGLPANISGCYIGWGDSYNGKFYLPVSSGTGLLKEAAKGVTPTVYAIDAATARATVFMTLKSDNVIKGFTIATK